jgi:hypothetical protein
MKIGSEASCDPVYFHVPDSVQKPPGKVTAGDRIVVPGPKKRGIDGLVYFSFFDLEKWSFGY